MCLSLSLLIFFFFFFNDTATTEIYTLSLHDALPIFPDVQNFLDCFGCLEHSNGPGQHPQYPGFLAIGGAGRDRKSTRLNSSHRCISYAVFCLKKKKKSKHTINYTMTTN